MSAIDRARETINGGLAEPVAPAWFDFYDTGRLDGFAGYAYLHFNRYDEANRALHAAAKALLPAAIKQRAVAPRARLRRGGPLDQHLPPTLAQVHRRHDVEPVQIEQQRRSLIHDSRPSAD
jgi:hypothetical protein